MGTDLKFAFKRTRMGGASSSFTGLLATEGGDGTPAGVELIGGGDLLPPPQPTNSSERAKKRERQSCTLLFLTAPLFYYLSVAFLALCLPLFFFLSSIFYFLFSRLFSFFYSLFSIFYFLRAQRACALLFTSRANSRARFPSSPEQPEGSWSEDFLPWMAFKKV